MKLSKEPLTANTLDCRGVNQILGKSWYLEFGQKKLSQIPNPTSAQRDVCLRKYNGIKSIFQGKKTVEKIHPPQNKISYPNPKQTQNKVLSFEQSKPISAYCINLEWLSIVSGGNKTLNQLVLKLQKKQKNAYIYKCTVAKISLQRYRISPARAEMQSTPWGLFDV